MKWRAFRCISHPFCVACELFDRGGMLDLALDNYPRPLTEKDDQIWSLAVGASELGSYRRATTFPSFVGQRIDRPSASACDVTP